jgi:hypothetical protein
MNDIVLHLLRTLGNNAGYLKRNGKLESAERQESAQKRLRAMSHEQQEAFAARWKAEGHHCPSGQSQSR